MSTEHMHDPDIWFSDGNIVLRAEQTLFRVYRGILCRASPIFRDMLHIGHSQSCNPADTYEECPLVVMAGDSAVDMRTFLRTLHDSSIFQMKLPSVDEIPQIVSVLRLSTKYDVSYLRRPAIEVLQAWYPTALSNFEALGSNTSLGLSHHIMVANVARQAFASVLLPSALLLCATKARDSYELYDGISRTDGLHVELLPENKRSIFIGRPQLEYAGRTRTFSFFYSADPRGPGCANRGHGNRKCADWCKDISWESVLQKDHLLDPFFPFFEVARSFVVSSCCRVCSSSWEAQNRAGVEMLWKELPSIFDLQPWSVLQSTTDNLTVDPSPLTH
ncbi:hypothetical protein BDY19DRAFT_994870 [Irpex rosettiformis]|uniref:Uncharacterized protein n=1 Tax=Irpex rosettiformis TaxID=378272 RepID=A0ACB8U080_9APHY|nr:hypothetical protein BDY19DRAFT_994870 [Irpex rosettiformis]